MSSTAWRSSSPCSRVRESQVENSSAWPIAAAVRRRARPRVPVPAIRTLARGVEHPPEAAHQLPHDGHRRRVAQEVLHHLLHAPVVAVHLLEGAVEALGRIGDGLPALEIRGRIRRQPVGGAGSEQGRLVGEVPVDGRAANPGALGHGADRGAGRAERPVQLDGALGDPHPGRLRRFGTALHLVWALLIGHWCLINLDIRRRRR